MDSLRLRRVGVVTKRYRLAVKAVDVCLRSKQEITWVGGGLVHLTLWKRRPARSAEN